MTRRWLRQPHEDKPSLRDAYIVHGLVVHGFGAEDHRLTGVLTRVGPDPVVNFSRGAQLV